jgi:malate synthase
MSMTLKQEDVKIFEEILEQITKAKARLNSLNPAQQEAFAWWWEFEYDATGFESDELTVLHHYLMNE